MTKLIHTDLVTLGNRLGYPLNEGGLCQGFSGMLSQAWLANDEKTFFKRLDFIETYNNDFDQLKKDIDVARLDSKGKPFDTLDEKTKLLLEIPAFYEGVELYLMPEKHTDLFANDAIYQENIDTVYSLVRSKQLEQDNLSIVLNKAYAFDSRYDLSLYLKDLKEALGSQGSTAPIFLSSSNHAVSFRYNEQKETWEYVDTNDFMRYPEDKSYSRELDSYSLANSIFESFHFDHGIVINTTIVTKSNNQKELTELKDRLDDFDKKKYAIGPKEINIYDNKQVGVLSLACREGNLDTVRELLKYSNIDVNHAEEDGSRSLHRACYHGHLDVVHELLERTDIKVNQVRYNGTTALIIACEKGHLDVVRELLKHKDIQVNEAMNNGITALIMACYHGRLDVIHELLERTDIKVNEAMNNGDTALIIACENGHLDVVRELLKHKDIQVNQVMNNGDTALIIACENGHLDIVRELLEHKDIKVNQARNSGVTPLDVAKDREHSQIVDLLTRKMYEEQHKAEELKRQETLKEAQPEANAQHEVTNKYKYDDNVHRDRFHLFKAHLKAGAPEADPARVAIFKQLKQLKDDTLKKAILEDIKQQIEHIDNKKDLAELKGEIMASDEYKVLAQGQGLVAESDQKINKSIKTLSIKAFESLFDEKEQKLPNGPQATTRF